MSESMVGQTGQDMVLLLTRILIVLVLCLFDDGIHAFAPTAQIIRPNILPDRRIKDTSTFCTRCRKSSLQHKTLTTDSSSSSSSSSIPIISSIPSGSGLFNQTEDPSCQPVLPILAHEDVIWTLRPPPPKHHDDDHDYGHSWWRTPLYRRIARHVLHFRLERSSRRRRKRRIGLRSSNSQRSSLLTQEKRRQPVLQIPAGGQALLECYYYHNCGDEDEQPLQQQQQLQQQKEKQKHPSKRWRRIAKCGITTECGPAIPALQRAVDRLFYGHDQNNNNNNTNHGEGKTPTQTESVLRAAAIQYMFVEPEYRKRGVGTLILQVVSFLHAYQNMDYTVLVANDKGNRGDSSNNHSNHENRKKKINEEGRLIAWYQDHGFLVAPELHDAFGTRNGQLGVPMIAPTQPQRQHDL